MTAYAKTAADLADHCEVSRRTIIDWQRLPGFPRKSARGWYLPAVDRWLEARRGPDDPLMAGPTTPGLERYRLARAQREELSLARELRDVFSRAEVEAVMGPLMDAHRHASERIQRDNLAGVEAVQAIREAFEDGQQQLNERFGIAEPPAADGATGGPAAQDAPG
jgi:hypothetical protein